MNTPTYTGLSYHLLTAHKRNRLDGAVLDWANQPDVFKHYPEAVHTPLIPMDGLCGDCLWDLVSGQDGETRVGNHDLSALSGVLAMGNGITFERVHGGTLYTFRSAASAGALYPVEIYVESHHIPSLVPGLYHVDIRKSSLAHFKKNPDQKMEHKGPLAVIYLTGMFFRSAWKYRKRAYRYILNDLGHVAANILLGARSYGFRPVLSYDFPDEALNWHLGLDPSKEVCLARIELWDSSKSSHADAGDWSILDGQAVFRAQPVSAREIVYPEIMDIHGAGSVSVKKTTDSYDYSAMLDRVQRWENLPRDSREVKRESLGWAISKRRSRRNFADRNLSRDQALALVSLMASAWRMIGENSRVSPGLLLGFLSGNISDFEPGFYLIDAQNNRFGLVENGFLIPSMAGACLDQMWLKNAGLQFLMIGDLKAVDETWGPRGYRYVMSHAGILGQIIYLGATALGLGCCGIGAFYDDETAHILDLQPHEHLLYLVAAGHVKLGCFAG